MKSCLRDAVEDEIWDLLDVKKEKDLSLDMGAVVEAGKNLLGQFLSAGSALSKGKEGDIEKEEV